jgi:hypothetical protein
MSSFPNIDSSVETRKASKAYNTIIATKYDGNLRAIGNIRITKCTVSTPNVTAMISVIVDRLASSYWEMWGWQTTSSGFPISAKDSGEESNE